jgi:ABC-type sugar transport system ATPase subunit
LTSSGGVRHEVEEIVGLCQRVIVLREGRFASELRGAEISEAAILERCFAA